MLPVPKVRASLDRVARRYGQKHCVLALVLLLALVLVGLRVPHSGGGRTVSCFFLGGGFCAVCVLDPGGFI